MAFLCEEVDIDELESFLLTDEVLEDFNVSNRIAQNIQLQEVALNGPPESVLAISGHENSKSFVHDGDTDSSDDEEFGSFLANNLNEFGRNIHCTLKQQQKEKIDRHATNSIDQIIKLASQTQQLKKKTPELIKKKLDTIFCDSIFGMRVINPLISSQIIKERMFNKTFVTMANIRDHVETNDLKCDWIIAGALVSKSPTRTSQTGSQFSIWTLSDLKGDIKMITLFLFQNAHKELWKTMEGMVVAILNPSVIQQKSETNREATLSIDDPKRVMIFGSSKDMGKCKSKKKNGDPCFAIVNLGTCEYCVYHVKNEYSKASRRPDIQSSTSGRGLNGLTELQNRMFGKNKIVYGSSSVTAITLKKSSKIKEHDQKRLKSLSECNNPQCYPEATYSKSIATTQGINQNRRSHVELNQKQRNKDFATLKSLTRLIENNTSTITEGIPTPIIMTTPSCSTVQVHSQKLKTPNRNTNSVSSSNAAKAKALSILKKIALEKKKPQLTKPRQKETFKRCADISFVNMDSECSKKKTKLEEINLKIESEKLSRIQRIMGEKSSHVDLVVTYENEQQEKYFDKLERKEAMEDKMMNTFKIECKVISCLKCKYTSFSASDSCKKQRHPLKITNAEKRFFKCKDCDNRTVSPFRLPKVSCSNCQSSRWERAAMMRDSSEIMPQTLSIRGDEEKFFGNLQTNLNLNLLVPDE